MACRGPSTGTFSGAARNVSLSESLCVRHKLMAKENEMNASHPVVE